MSRTVVSLLAPISDVGFEAVTEAINSAKTPARFLTLSSSQRNAAVDAGAAELTYLCGLLYVRKREAGVLLDPLVAPVPMGRGYGGKAVYFADVIVSAG